MYERSLNSLSGNLIKRIISVDFTYSRDRRYLSIYFAAFLPDAIACTTRLAPLTVSPAANTFCRLVV
jgi:hypothetical protein